MSPLEGWENFYVIVGSAAGGLIGLQFVVITLISERPRPRLGDATKAFSTPTIVHFASVLVLSALIAAPWESTELLAKIWGLSGFIGLLYSIRVGLQMKRVVIYKAELADWFHFLILPACAYLILLIAMFTSESHVHYTVYSVGLSMLLLLVTGIHNSWDTVTYHVVSRQRENEAEKR